MTPEERSLLQRTYELAEENTAILRSMRRSGRISLALRIGYWVVIILLSVGAYYVIQPYVDAIRDLFTAPPSSAPSAAFNANQFLDLLK